MTQDQKDYIQYLYDNADAVVDAGWIAMGIHMSLPDDEINKIYDEVENEISRIESPNNY